MAISITNASVQIAAKTVSSLNASLASRSPAPTPAAAPISAVRPIITTGGSAKLSDETFGGLIQAQSSQTTDVGSQLSTGSASPAQRSEYVSLFEDTPSRLTGQPRITSQTNVAQSLIDINASSVGSLIDAGMEEESTKLEELQTQEQLAVQSDLNATRSMNIEPTELRV